GEPQIGFVHERRRLQGLSRPLAPHVRLGQTPKLLIDGLGHSIRGFRRSRRIGHGWSDILNVRGAKCAHSMNWRGTSASTGYLSRSASTLAEYSLRGNSSRSIRSFSRRISYL